MLKRYIGHLIMVTKRDFFFFLFIWYRSVILAPVQLSEALGQMPEHANFSFSKVVCLRSSHPGAFRLIFFFRD